jgi:hypothetical protein
VFTGNALPGSKKNVSRLQRKPSGYRLQTGSSGCGKTLIYAGFWEGHDFTGCGKTHVSYQGIALAIPQVPRNQLPL